MAEYYAHMPIPELPSYFTVQEAQDYINATNALLETSFEAGLEVRAIMAERKRAWQLLMLSEIWKTLP
jgi:hypothetical protein